MKDFGTFEKRPPPPSHEKIFGSQSLLSVLNLTALDLYAMTSSQIFSRSALRLSQ